MIVLVVIAILAAVAYPSYRDYVLRAHRSDAKDALLRVQLEQEKWRTNNASYTTTLSNLGLTSASTDGWYTIALPSASTVAYTATATAQGTQANDTGCTVLQLAVTAGGENKTPASCW
jgi:type IV pilus assembly protein PilE